MIKDAGGSYEKKGSHQHKVLKPHDMIPLFTDWLALSIRLNGDVERTPAHHKWVEFEGGTNVWNKRRVLYNEYGEKVLTLLSHPKSTLIDSSMALVEIANEWLYHGIGVRDILTKLKWCVYYEVVSLSRLDLAVDFNPNKRQAKQIVGLAKGALEVSSKQNGSGFWSVNKDEWVPEQWRGLRCPHCISWGHKESDVKWKLYYKTKELREASGGSAFDKPYIVDKWREFGMDIDNVWRLEVSVKHCNKLTFNGKVLDLGIWGNDTKALFESLYTSRFQLSHGGTRKKGGRVEHIPFLPVQKINCVRCRKYEGERSSSARISLLRSLVRSLDQEEVLLDTPTRNDVLKMIDNIVHRDELKRYIDGMLGMDYEVWRMEKENIESTGRCVMFNERQVITMTPNYGFDMLLAQDDKKGVSIDSTTVKCYGGKFARKFSCQPLPPYSGK